MRTQFFSKILVVEGMLQFPRDNARMLVYLPNQFKHGPSESAQRFSRIGSYFIAILTSSQWIFRKDVVYYSII